MWAKGEGNVTSALTPNQTQRRHRTLSYRPASNRKPTSLSRRQSPPSPRRRLTLAGRRPPNGRPGHLVTVAPARQHSRQPAPRHPQVERPHSPHRLFRDRRPRAVLPPDPSPGPPRSSSLATPFASNSWRRIRRPRGRNLSRSSTHCSANRRSSSRPNSLSRMPPRYRLRFGKSASAPAFALSQPRCEDVGPGCAATGQLLATSRSRSTNSPRTASSTSSPALSPEPHRRSLRLRTIACPSSSSIDTQSPPAPHRPYRRDHPAHPAYFLAEALALGLAFTLTFAGSAEGLVMPLDSSILS